MPAVFSHPLTMLDSFWDLEVRVRLLFHFVLFHLSIHKQKIIKGQNPLPLCTIFIWSFSSKFLPIRSASDWSRIRFYQRCPIWAQPCEMCSNQHNVKFHVIWISLYPSSPRIYNWSLHISLFCPNFGYIWRTVQPTRLQYHSRYAECPYLVWLTNTSDKTTLAKSCMAYSAPSKSLP